MQGYAIVKFTITESGTIENVEMVEGKCGTKSPTTVFRDCSSLTLPPLGFKLKYKPKIVDEGQAG